MLALLKYDSFNAEDNCCVNRIRVTAKKQTVSFPYTLSVSKVGYICRYRKALYFGSLGISLYLELFCFLSFISFVLRKLT